ncbi:MAG: phosphoenolpyruvate synthase, partial [Cyanobacteria bacterium NC_groundwater_1444_Ag_S-0.65um_54_12]|nr:phosphoenolpyruvate synthase [Cyanobacteria bacterium NC_groundwater_1444_Ag_S-0.65um_54_12]
MDLTSSEIPEAPVEYLGGDASALVGQRLTMEAFAQLAGLLAGQRFVKVVVERLEGSKRLAEPRIHFVNHARYQFHANYIAEQILKISTDELDANLDRFNREFYLQSDRRCYLGILALHERQERFFTIETVEIDNMDDTMLREFFATVAAHLDPSVPLFFKPGNHQQECMVARIDPVEVPRVFFHELFSSAPFIALNGGAAQGRLRVFRGEADYRSARSTLEWFDIIAMARVPDDIPRLAGIINAEPTTPLSHTNVLAFGWGIPNAIQLGVFERIAEAQLDGQWVSYRVDVNAPAIELCRSDPPPVPPQRPAWLVQQIRLEEPEIGRTAIADLAELRGSDRYRYGTKAANLGELRYVLENGSERLLGFYRIKRPPRPDLLPFIAEFLGLAASASAAEIGQSAWRYLQATIRIPRGIAIPFSIQREFL